MDEDNKLKIRFLFEFFCSLSLLVKVLSLESLDLVTLMACSCDWVRAYLHNPNSDVKEEDRNLCDGIGTK